MADQDEMSLLGFLVRRSVLGIARAAVVLVVAAGLLWLFGLTFTAFAAAPGFH
jgi:hypothetical protein